MATKKANVTVHGIDLAVEFDHQPKEAQTRTYPGCEEKLEITDVSFKDIPFATHWLSNYFIELIEEQILERCV